MNHLYQNLDLVHFKKHKGPILFSNGVHAVLSLNKIGTLYSIPPYYNDT